MKITNIHLPDITKDYIQHNIIADLAEKLSTAFVKMGEESIFIFMKDEDCVGYALKILKEKSEPITKGNGKYRVYEYELGYTENSGHIFRIGIDGKDYFCTIYEISNMDNGDLRIVFNII